MGRADGLNIESRRARLRLHITTSAESILRKGHPWLFSESIKDQNREGEPGEIAAVYDRKDEFFALGLYDPDSPIRLRVLHVGKPAKLDESWWAARLEQALARRRGLFGPETTAYRCINGESDGWPGLVLDRYDRTLVLKLYTAAWFGRLSLLGKLIQRQLQPERLVLRLSRNIQNRAREWCGLQDGTVIAGARLEAPVVFSENTLRFEADVLKGQKTGFFLDQRDNRKRVGQLSQGLEVLNAFSFSGGFSLYAARGGARSVTDLDISPHALAAAGRNFKFNETVHGVAACRHEAIQCDVFEWLAVDRQRKFELIVLDPPSLAKRASDKLEALRAYGRLAFGAMRHLAAGGILLACSCSAHVTPAEFFSVIRQSASSSGRKFTEIETTSHPPDHPATFIEAEYLKGIYLRC